MDQKDITRFLYSLYHDISPITISMACHKKHGLYDGKSFVYSGRHLPSLYEVFNKAKPRPGEIFYALGSGSSRLALYAALSFLLLFFHEKI